MTLAAPLTAVIFLPLPLPKPVFVFVLFLFFCYQEGTQLEGALVLWPHVV